MASASLTERVTALEAEVKELRKLINGEKPSWKETVSGAFADDPDFLDAMSIGREYRESQRPKPRKRKKK